MRVFYRWHRRIGVVATLFIILLSITGILLNHNAQLSLHKVNIESPWLLELYNIDNTEQAEFAYPQTLNLDTVVLDLHTGKFFGKLTPIIMDLVALMLLALSFSGLFMWAKRMRIKK
jgi:uncharacterized iron-regulated membrane protein